MKESKLKETLKERGEKYGKFSDYATLCSHLKLTFELSVNKNTTPLHEEALDMIFSKIARILNGDPDHIDNWHDIAGYATLVENELIEREENK